ncbi:MAG: HAD-IA family hydrolase [Actinomycetota bacterium]
MPLNAVIFDVDGTIAETERHGHRVAFNQSFEDHDLPYHWDPEPYGALLVQPGGEKRLERYLLTEGHSPEEAAALAASLQRRKQERFLAIVRDGKIPLRNGITRLFDELVGEGIAVGVATTAGGVWVIELLELLLGRERLEAFRVIVTGEDVAELKPDPEVYQKALAGLGCTAAEAVAIEDSRVGMLSAKAAGLACLAVRNAYTADHDLAGADLVIDDLDTASIDVAALRELRDGAR